MITCDYYVHEPISIHHILGHTQQWGFPAVPGDMVQKWPKHLSNISGNKRKTSATSHLKARREICYTLDSLNSTFGSTANGLLAEKLTTAGFCAQDSGIWLWMGFHTSVGNVKHLQVSHMFTRCWVGLTSCQLPVMVPFLWVLEWYLKWGPWWALGCPRPCCTSPASEKKNTAHKTKLEILTNDTRHNFKDHSAPDHNFSILRVHELHH